jgi:C4-dicarboxylate-specific signal transduction histidine kinase
MPPDLPPVHARPQRLQQVLLNLMTNAKDALLEAPNVQPRAVSLQASAAEGGVELAVVDNGPGLPGDLHEKVFEPFITTKRARGGTGLGLAISRSIVEGYGGTLEATSAAGEGTTFSVWLPTCAAE